MTPDWFLWYGLKIGLDYNTSLDIPFIDLQNLISVEQIKHEGAKPKIVLTDDQAFDFWGGEDIGY